MGFLLAYATSLDAFMPYILSGIKIILRNRNYKLEYLASRTSSSEDLIGIFTIPEIDWDMPGGVLISQTKSELTNLQKKLWN
jgi:hypothetical protein